MKSVVRLTTLLILLGCGGKKEVQVDQSRLFSKMPGELTGISFFNEVENFEKFNIFSYRNFYNGGGVAIGDINNDGLSDIYLTSNLSENKLYLNKGNFNFEDVTAAAGVEGNKGWSTGVVFVDINNDRMLDIYVCNAGYVRGDDQENELFINNGDGTFSESAAEYGLNNNGYTTHASFFDYDKDGDLDVYMLNNSFIPVNTLNYSNKRDLYAEDWPVKDFLKGGGDKLLRNDDGKFIDVTKEAGIFGSLIGFGLGVTVGDVNGDLYEDIYISNDFFERDYLYINQADGTFKEDIKNWMGHISLSSMGADMADINNDGFPELFVTEMLPDDETRVKTKVQYENYQTYQLKLDRDFYHQYMHNTLQYNNRDKSFSEIAWYSGVAASDWSWGALMLDVDNDSYRDILVCNGIYQDVTDQDFIDFFANDIIQKMVLTGKKEELNNVLKEIPSNPIPNKLFLNNGDLTFSDSGDELGLGDPSFSNGAAYGDLDNDGDIDLVISNVNQEVLVYRNNTDSIKNNNAISVLLEGDSKNTYAIGSRINVYTGDEVINHQLIPSRGFQSSMDYKTVFGLGTIVSVDSIEVIWPDKSITSIIKPEINELITIKYENNSGSDIENNSNPIQLFRQAELSIEAHKENEFVDFYREGMIIRMLSKEGPVFAKGDVNNDGQEDLFVGGATLQSSALYIQRNGKLEKSNEDLFNRDAYYEDTAAEFFDADNDGDLDLYIGTGGNQKPAGAMHMQDRIYLNDGKGNFSKSYLPKTGLNTSTVEAFDLEGDGDLDLFVGSRSVPNIYGISPPSFLLENDGKGNFTDITEKVAPDLLKAGMITQSLLLDIDGDDQKELILIGEWMAPKIYSIANGRLEEKSSGLENYSGWWYDLEASDIDGDGDLDLVLGNRGENFSFTGTQTDPAKLWLSDFDDNGTIEKVITKTMDGRDIPIHLKRELTTQLVSIKKDNLKHAEYATKSLEEIFSPEQLNSAQVLTGNWFKSSIAYNDGKGNFEIKALPSEAQFSCICAIYCKDINNDNRVDIVMGGNFSGFTPQFSKLDASYGNVLLNQGDGEFQSINANESGIRINGDVKDFVELNINGVDYLISAVNDSEPKVFIRNN